MPNGRHSDATGRLLLIDRDVASSRLVADGLGAALAGTPEIAATQTGRQAVDALRQAGLAETSAVVGHDGEADAVREVVRPASPLIGTVGFFPERYGRGLVSLVLRLLKGEPIAPFHYIEHELIDGKNAGIYLATSPGSSTNLSSQATLAQLCAI